MERVVYDRRVYDRTLGCVFVLLGIARQRRGIYSEKPLDELAGTVL
jgi:hypothetical protein